MKKEVKFNRKNKNNNTSMSALEQKEEMPVVYDLPNGCFSALHLICRD